MCVCVCLWYFHAQSLGGRSVVVDGVPNKLASFKTGPETSPLTVVAVLDPLSEAGQRTGAAVDLMSFALFLGLNIHSLSQASLFCAVSSR